MQLTVTSISPAGRPPFRRDKAAFGNAIQAFGEDPVDHLIRLSGLPQSVLSEAGAPAESFLGRLRQRLDEARAPEREAFQALKALVDAEERHLVQTPLAPVSTVPAAGAQTALPPGLVYTAGFSEFTKALSRALTHPGNNADEEQPSLMPLPTLNQVKDSDSPMWTGGRYVLNVEDPGKPFDNTADVVDAELDLNKHPRLKEELGVTVPTKALLDYGAQWGMLRTVSEIWQNPFDGHGGTLDGVRLVLQRVGPNKDYRVTLESGANFPYWLLTKWGASGKATRKTVGHHGEGGKLVPLVLMHHYGAKDVQYASTNWQLNLSAQPCEEDPALGLILHRRLEKLSKPVNGNKFEFTIPAENYHFIYHLLQGINLYQTRKSDIFNNPTYRDKLGGFRLHLNRKGNIYIAGQQYAQKLTTEKRELLAGLRREVPFEELEEAQWQPSYPEATIWLNGRPKGATIDRDRTGFSPADIYKHMIAPLVARMTDEQLARTLVQLHPLWHRYDPDKQTPALLHAVMDRALKSHIRLDIPLKTRYVAVPQVEWMGHAASEMDLSALHPVFERLGIPMLTPERITAWLSPSLEPSPSDTRKLAILKTAGKLVESQFNSVSAGQAEHPVIRGMPPLNWAFPIRFFDNSQPPKKEIVQIYTPTAYWWEQRNFRQAEFGEALASYMDGLSAIHGTRHFMLPRREMQPWLQAFIRTSLSPETRGQLKLLQRLWKTADNQQALSDRAVTRPGRDT